MGMKTLYLPPEEKAHLESRHHRCENRKKGDATIVALQTRFRNSLGNKW